MRVAILEDDPAQLALLATWLSLPGYEISAHESCGSLMGAAPGERFDLYVLDWELPDGAGIDVLKWIRANVPGRPAVLFVTVRDSEQDIVTALTAGADDYLAKPVRRNELIARVRALLRRAYPQDQDGPTKFEFSPYVFDVVRSEARFRRAVVDLSPKEFALALAFFSHAGQALSRARLLELVWGTRGDVTTRTVDTHVCQLRGKLALNSKNGYRITPLRAFGYRLERRRATGTAFRAGVERRREMRADPAY